MNNRNGRKAAAEDTLQSIENGFYLTPSGKRIDFAEQQRKAETETQIYTPEQSDALLTELPPATTEYDTQISVSHQTTLEGVRQQLEKGNTDVLCLNFASAKNPGGGFLGGSQAQEESLARSTGLYPCLLNAEE